MLPSSSLSDIVIILSYYMIPLELCYFLHNTSRSIPMRYQCATAMFALFIMSCGTTHLLDVLTTLQFVTSDDSMHLAKAITAVCSLVTAVVMLYIIPDILRSFEYTERLELSVREQIRELSSANKAAEQAKANKREFMAFLCHEIRNPLHVITANVEFILETALTNEQREFGRAINDNAKLMASIVNDVLDISRLQAGRMKFECIPFDLHDLTSALAKNVRQETENKKITLKMEYESNAARIICGDPTRVHQILLNLVSNSIKFTPSGGTVGVRVRIHKKNPINHYSATGIRRITSSVEGTSELDIDEDDTFLATAHPPSPLPSASSAVDILTKGLSKHGVLTDGSAESELINDTVHEEGGHEQVHLISGAHTIDDDDVTHARQCVFVQLEVTDSGVGISPSLMPQLFSPYTQAKLSTVRLYGGTGLGLSIVHQMIKNMHGHIHVSSRLGRGSTFTVTLRSALPAPSEMLQAEMSTAEKKAKSQLASVTTHADVNSTTLSFPLVNAKRPTVLVVDDNDVNRKILHRILSSLGYGVQTCCNGLEAVNSVTERSESDPFLCVLMDISMPVMDGYEATRHIRAFNNTSAKLYIVALTANALNEQRMKATEAGMNEFATKPIRKQQIQQILENVLRHSQPPILIPTPTSTPTPSSSPLSSSSTSPSNCLLSHFPQLLPPFTHKRWESTPVQMLT